MKAQRVCSEKSTQNRMYYTLMHLLADFSVRWFNTKTCFIFYKSLSNLICSVHDVIFLS